MVVHSGKDRSAAGKWLSAIAAALIALSLLSGCGGGDDDSTPDTTAQAPPETTASPALDKGEIIAEGDAICAEVNAAVAGLESSGITPATQLSQRTDLYTGMIERLRGLDSQDPGLTAVFSAGRDLVQAAAAAEEAAVSGDTEATVAAETTVAAALSAFERSASSYGFTGCGGEAAAPTTVVPDSGPGTTDETGEAPVEPSPAPEPVEPTAPSGGADAGGAPPDTADGGAGADGGTGTPEGDGTGAAGGGGADSSTGGYSPGG